MTKIRKTVNRENDMLIYFDEDYLIYKKDAEIVGNMTASYDLISIGIAGLNSGEQPLMFKKKDHDKIIDSWIEVLNKIKKEYPDD